MTTKSSQIWHFFDIDCSEDHKSHCKFCTECVFSTAGDIISNHRTCLLPENDQMLIFLKLNSHYLD